MIEGIIRLLLMACSTACSWPGQVSAAEPLNRTGIIEKHVQETEGSGHPANRTSLRVMTFNIQWQGYDHNKFHDTGFDRRKPLVLRVLTEYDADVIGLQEASIGQRAGIAPGIPGYGMYPLPTEAGDECVLYRLDRFVLEAGGHEYLRRVPELPRTNIGVRDFVWVYLHDRVGGKRFYVLNLHLDHRSSNRGRQLDGVLIGEWIRNRKFADPVILTGDFNGTPDMPRYLYLTGQSAYPDQDGLSVSMPMPMLDTFTVANPEEKYTGTVNSGFFGAMYSKQLDYVFVPARSKVLGSEVVYYKENGIYPSDHFPVISEFELE